MRDETKNIINEIMQQWSDNKLYVMTSIDKENHEQYFVVRDNKNEYERIDNEREKEQDPNQVVNKKDVICKITATRYSKENEAYIYFRGCYSIDSDFRGVYEYIKEFLAVIKAKSRQMNALGVKFKLGMITQEELNDINEVFVENKQQVLEKMFPEMKEHEEAKYLKSKAIH